MRLLPAAIPLLFALSASATAAEVVRHANPGGSSPIAMAVEVPAGRSTVYLSGATPALADATAPKDSPQAYGDTYVQTVSVLTRIRERLGTLGLDMGDVVKMQVFLVGDPDNGGRMDLDGFRRGYAQFFGAEAGQPNLPARSTFQIAALGNPAFRVEIEVVAVRR